MLKSRNFLCKLTQSVRKIGTFFFEFEKKNLLTAAKAPLWCDSETSVIRSLFLPYNLFVEG